MTVTTVRRGVQLLSLLLFAWLLVKTTWPLAVPVSPQLFLRMDPLAALSVALSPGRTWALLGLFWPALVLLAATALLGRFFCGWLCPLGVCVDTADRCLARARGKKPRLALPHVVKYAVLALVLVTAVFGAHLFWVLDPIPLLTRVGAVALDGPVRHAYDLLVPTLREHGMRVRPVAERPFALAGLTGGLFVLILLSGALAPRLWCRGLCPLGALLGLVGRVGLWRRKAATDCNSCACCVGVCPMGAIPATAPTETIQAECIQCYDCVTGCARGMNRMVIGGAPAVHEVDAGRRGFLIAGASGVAYGALSVIGVIPRFVTSRLIRPPGAVARGPEGALTRMMTEDEFRSKCLRCGQCMKVCPTGGLQPSVGEAGLDGFYTPVLKPRVGWCEESCVACGMVCPSGALIPISRAEKPFIRIGRAEIDRTRCLAWGEGDEYRECLVCNEHCSYGAVGLEEDGEAKRPHVSHRECVGCGQCEHACPVKDEAAIVVHRAGRR